MIILASLELLGRPGASKSSPLEIGATCPHMLLLRVEGGNFHRGSLGHLGAILRALEAMLEPSGCQKAPKMEPKRVPNRAPEATRAEYGETLIFNDNTQDFNVFSSLRPLFLS